METTDEDRTERLYETNFYSEIALFDAYNLDSRPSSRPQIFLASTIKGQISRKLFISLCFAPCQSASYGSMSGLANALSISKSVNPYASMIVLECVARFSIAWSYAEVSVLRWCSVRAYGEKMSL